MSDEQGTAQEPTTASEPPAPKWGDPISAERQAELQDILDDWEASEADYSDTNGPFHGVRLTGADVFWLAEQSGRDELGWVPNLHLEGANLDRAHLEGANLSQAHLERARLHEAQLERAILEFAHLEGANLYLAHLEGDILQEA